MLTAAAMMWHKHVYAASKDVLCTSISLGTEVPKERRIGRHEGREVMDPSLFKISSALVIWSTLFLSGKPPIWR